MFLQDAGNFGYERRTIRFYTMQGRALTEGSWLLNDNDGELPHVEAAPVPASLIIRNELAQWDVQQGPVTQIHVDPRLAVAMFLGSVLRAEHLDQITDAGAYLLLRQLPFDGQLYELRVDCQLGTNITLVNEPGAPV